MAGISATEALMILTPGTVYDAFDLAYPSKKG